MKRKYSTIIPRRCLLLLTCLTIVSCYNTLDVKNKLLFEHVTPLHDLYVYDFKTNKLYPCLFSINGKQKGLWDLVEINTGEKSIVRAKELQLHNEKRSCMYI